MMSVTSMYAELVVAPHGRSLAVDTVLVQASFSDDPRLFASLQARGSPGHEVFARWTQWVHEGDSGAFTSYTPTLVIDIGGEHLTLRFSLDAGSSTEPLEALTHATHAVLLFEHAYDMESKHDYTEVSVPLPPDPEGVLAEALRWSRSQTRRSPTTAQAATTSRGRKRPGLRGLRALLAWRPRR